jgi:hypothetical protein
LVSLGVGAFGGTNIETFTTYSSMAIPAFLLQNSTALRSVNILGNVETIGASAFASSSLVSITPPASLISIGGSAFYGTLNLTSITLPEGFLSIADYAFSNSGITSITLPASLISIGEYAFDNATALNSVTYYGLESPDSASVVALLETFPCSWDYSPTGTNTGGGTPTCNPSLYPPLVVTLLSGTGDGGAGALATATTAVALAESSDLESDLGAAQILVTALSAGTGKDALQIRISIEILVISRAAAAAVATALVAAAAARLAALNAAASALATKAAQNATKDLEAFVAPIATPGESAKPAPSIDTYLSAGVKGVTVGNLDLVNILVKELASTQVTTKALVEIVKIATIVITFSIITNSTQTIIKKSELGSIGISTIAGKDLRAFTAFIATRPVGDRNTPVELVAAAEAFKVKLAADIQRVKDARIIARAANRAAIIAIFKAKR